MAKKEEGDPLEVVEKFLRKSLGMASYDAITIGIDPGASGAIAFLCERHCAVIDIPVNAFDVKRTKKTTKTERAISGHKTKRVKGTTTKADLHAICEIFKLLRPHKDRTVVGLEEVPTSLGPGKRHAEIMLNRAYALWPLFLHSKGYPVEEVRPTVWKQKFNLIGKDKEASRQKALSLYPGADIGLKKHHDRAEALLIATYVRRLRAGEI
jgi:crossover junction endodeoxyribonuclease RuvC